MSPKVASKRKPIVKEAPETRKRVRKDQDSSPTNDETENKHPEEVNEDDVCPICHLLLYRPVRTRCGHALCESCMMHWADASVTSQMTIVSLEDDPNTNSEDALSANCPMCRTPTTATLNTKLHRTLRSKYPRLYPVREAEEQPTSTDASIETLGLYIGNTHRIRPRNPDEDYETSNIHEWTFFVRPTTHQHIIEEVQIFLHPTFRPSRIIRTLPPYEIRRLGWGVFMITARIILKAGYSWVTSDAERAPDGAEKGMLPLNWTLSFDGKGCQGKCRLKVKGEAWAEERAQEEEREIERERTRMRRAYERDGNWIPPVED
jgi:hypothetical protein